MILDNESDEELTEEQQEVIERNAEVLYGLIHARFITTAHGQQLMLDKFRGFFLSLSLSSRFSFLR